MAIRYATPPPDGGGFLRPTLIKIFSRDTPENREALGGSAASEIVVQQAHQVYFMELDEVVRGRTISAAPPRLWRYLVYVQERVIADAELFIDSAGKPHFAALNYGPVAQATVKGIRGLEGLTPREVDYELRALQIPALHFVAVWLHGATDDQILPIAPTRVRWTSLGRPLSEKELLDLLRPEATELMRLYGSAPRGSGG